MGRRSYTPHYESCNCKRCNPNLHRALREFNSQERWEKTRSSYDRDTGLAQTDYYSGTVGNTAHKRKVHVAINEIGDVIYVRDEDGTILYDKKNNIGHLPCDLNWSRY